jgi:fructose-1,6-bisphosphatase/inositol monophosphatase family enzyme
MLDLGEALRVATAAAREAGELLRRERHRAGGPRGAVDKAAADVEAEEAIRSRLLAVTPAWAFLGEETGRVAAASGAPVWLVDPNDGTRDFLRGARGSAVSIGLLVDGRPVLGVVYAFAYPDDEGDLFCWAAGTGPPSRNGRPAVVQLPRELGPRDAVLVSSGGDRDPESNLRWSAPARYRSVPSVAHRLALVATGEAAAAVSLYAPGAWDYAAGHALLRGSRGVLLDEAGQEVTYASDGSSQVARAFGGSEVVARELAARPWRVTTGASAGPRPVRLRPGEAEYDSARLGRAQGFLLGLVLGSAGEHAAEPQDRPGRLAGQPSAEAEMALSLARSLATGEVEGTSETDGDWSATTMDRAAAITLRAMVLGLRGWAWEAGRLADAARREAGIGSGSSAEVAARLAAAVAAAVRGQPDARTAARFALDWAAAEGARGHPAHRAAAVVLQALASGLGFEGGLAAAVARSRWGAGPAVAGALLGAVHGRAGLPMAWRVAVLSCRAHALRVEPARPARAWPVDVMELAERLLLLGT